MWLARALLFSTIELSQLNMSRLRALESHIPGYILIGLNPMDLPRLNRNSALNGGALVSVEFPNGEYWSNAAWPS